MFIDSQRAFQDSLKCIIRFLQFPRKEADTDDNIQDILCPKNTLSMTVVICVGEAVLYVVWILSSSYTLHGQLEEQSYR